MNDTWEILPLLGACLPLFSSLIWMLMITLSVHDSRTRLERKIKHTVLRFYIFLAISWTALLLYTYIPSVSLYFNVAVYLAYMLTPVQFYRYVCELSETAELKPFSSWHYALPVLIVSVLGVWSFFVPWDVQLGLVESRGQFSPEYPVYSRYFLFKPAMRFVYVIVYTVLSLVRLRRYYRAMGRKADKHPQPVRWITGLMGFVVVILLLSVPSVLLPRGEFVTSWQVLILTFLHAGEDFIIGYNVIRRNFLLYIPSVKERMDMMEADPKKNKTVSDSSQLPDEVSFTQLPMQNVKLTKKRFEEYVNSRKLWLHPDLKMTDLVEPLKTSRTSLSNFINKTYGMNFNRYINSLRLAELNRLMSLPSNAGKTVDDLLYEVGFVYKRNYTRTKEAEENGRNGNVVERAAGKGGME